ncbi:MAG: hypothetical protein ACR2MN_10835 [Acidimicrobiales bacterium]
MTVNGVTRHGPYMVLDLTATCTMSSCSGENDFSAGTATVPPAPASQKLSLDESLNNFSGLYLSDATGNISVAIRDSSNDPLTSDAELYWDVGQSYRIWAYAPDPSVHSISVVLPGNQARISDVPVPAP